MKLNIDFLCRSVLVILMFAATAAHANEQQNINFNSGIESFNKGDYTSAKRYFEKARNEGLSRAALYFNLGVTYYKLEQYSNSREAFKRSAQYKQMRALSYYNLGLVAEKAGDGVAAKSWFRKAYHGDNAKVAALAAIKLHINVKTKAASGANWMFANVAIGYDDNLIDPASGTGNTRGSFFTDYYLAYGAPLNKRSAGGMTFDVAAYLSQFRNLSAYNYNMLHAGLSQPFVTGVWSDKMAVQLEQSTLGGQSYQRSGIFELQARHKTNSAVWYRLAYKARFIQSLSTAYNYLHGWQQQFIASAKFGKNKATSLRYIYELNNRDGLVGAGTFASYSPTRHNIEASHESPIKTDLKWRTSFGYRVSDYADANVFTNRSRVNRSDDRLQITLGLIKKLSSSWKLNMEYQHTNNNSNIASYAYHRNSYRVNMQGLF